jgi:predicted transcriptional regulator
MPNMTIRVPDDLKQSLEEHPEINWSEVARQSMRDYLHRLNIADEIAAESELTEDDAIELSEAVKHDIAAHYRDTE